jgi:hypothetical protein
MTLNFPSLPAPSATTADACRIADWFRGVGFADVDTLPFVRRIEGNNLIVGISTAAGEVGRAELMTIHRAAAGRAEAFFSVGGYTAVAQEYADREHVALFRLDVDGMPVPTNAAARAMGSQRHYNPAPAATEQVAPKLVAIA